MFGRRTLRVAALLLPAVLVSAVNAPVGAQQADEPPFSGTIFLDPDIITAADPTSFVSLTATGQGERTVFDRRTNSFNTINAYLFDAEYSDGLTSEVQVNPEFGSVAAAQVEAQKYAEVLGRLPTALRRDMHAIWIHLGTEPFGGGNQSVLIHTGQAAEYEASGILEETLVHEASHTSLDADHATTSGWLTAQNEDGRFISTYARDNPTREDVAETFLLYLALRYRPDRISESLAATIRETVPHRLAYFDRQGLALGPMMSSRKPRSDAGRDGWVRESSKRSDRGGTVDVDGGRITVGVDKKGRERRGVLSFDTSGLPDTAVVTDLTLVLSGYQAARKWGPDELLVEVANGGLGGPRLKPGDFTAPADAGLQPTVDASRAGKLSLGLVEGQQAVSTTGLTQLRLSVSDPETQPGLLKFASGDAARSLRPRLIVKYGSP